MNYLFFIVLTINLGLIHSVPQFFRGRPNTKHGMLTPPVHDQTNSARSGWVEQKLNHFDPIDNRTWKQLYYLSDLHYTKGGPVFLMFGGEGAASSYWTEDGQMAAAAKKFNAMAVVLEHRYYGSSHPTPDMSVENLKYLTSEQALQDAAYFVEFLTAQESLNGSKWIAFGGSYSGTLAAFFRAKYPHLVAGAIASSAPVEAIVDFQNYMGVVTQSLGKECDDGFREATAALGKELQTPEGLKQIEKQFNLCAPLNGSNKNDVYNFVNNLVSIVAGQVQYNKISFEYSIDNVCQIMKDKTLSALDRYVKVRNELGGSGCFQFEYNKMIKEFSEISWDSGAANGNRQWTYQTCVEFGFFQSSSLKTQPFGPYFPVEFYVQQCADIFGPQYNANFVNKSVEFTNNVYGGFDMNVRKVVFPNGSIDPWHALGILKDLDDETKAILINGTAHCADMYDASSSDPKSLTDAKLVIMQYLDKFLHDK